MFERSRWIVTAFTALWAAISPAAESGRASPFIVSKWDASSGPVQRRLPSSVVISALQTRDGYLWLGTYNGLVRFDGDRFTVFNEGNTPGLPSNPIVFLFEDSRGRLWVGTDGGGIVVMRDGEVGRLEFGAGSSLGRVRSACEDTAGGVWFYTQDGQLGRFFGDGITGWQTGPSLSRSVVFSGGHVWLGRDQGMFELGSVSVSNNVSSLPALVTNIPAARQDFLAASRDGGIWRLADGRVEKWSAGQLEKALGNYAWTNSESVYVTSACEDLQGNLIVGVRGAGVFWYDANGKATQLSTEGALSHSGVLAVCQDREGNLWVGTDGGGLNRVRRRVSDVAPRTAGRVVQSACETPDGSLWVGFNGGGVMRWKDDESLDYGWDGQQHRPEDGLVSPSVTSVFADRAGQVWVGTRAPGALHQFRDGRFYPVAVTGERWQEVAALYQDRAGRLWVGRANGLASWDGTSWQVFTAREGLSTNAVRAIADDEAGNLWVGTDGGGLNQFRDGKFAVFRKSPDGLPGDRITSLLVDNAGALWVGTSAGLARLKEGRWTRLTTAAGLPSNSINYLVEDAEGFVWIGSNAGLVRVAKNSIDEYARGNTSIIACRTYDEADGLPTSESTSGSQPAAIRTRAGKLWFPTIAGLVGIDPSRLQRNTNQPRVMIEAVLLDERPLVTNSVRVKLPPEIVVPPGAERLEFQFTSLNLSASSASANRTLFRYQLEGQESRWSPAENRREARYTGLQPGEYRFHVTACNEDGVWNDTGATLAVRVLPPFWRTWWFLTLSGLAVFGVVAGTVHFISTQRLQRELSLLRQKEALERERSRIARDLHDQLGANLTRVSLLGELVETDKAEPAEVEAHARQISKTASETQRALDEIVWAANPANDTLEGLANYLCKYAHEFLTTAGLGCRLDVPAELPTTPIAPDFRHNIFLVAKEAVNNVVKHAQASAVRFQIKLEEARLVVEIEDDGRGPADVVTAGERGRNGLRNMRRRMEDVGGSFSITPASAKGTLVRLAAPLNRI